MAAASSKVNATCPAIPGTSIPLHSSASDSLYCRNERATVRCRLAASDHLITLVPIAAVLVASIRLPPFSICYCCIWNIVAQTRLSAMRFLPAGEEMGWFQHGSTIIVFAPQSFAFCEGIIEGAKVRMGQALLKLPQAQCSRQARRNTAALRPCAKQPRGRCGGSASKISLICPMQASIRCCSSGARYESARSRSRCSA